VFQILAPLNLKEPWAQLFEGRHLGFKFKFNLGKSIKSSEESGGGQVGGGPIDCGIGTEGVQEAGYKWA